MFYLFWLFTVKCTFYIDSRLLSLLCCIANWHSVNVGVAVVLPLLLWTLVLLMLLLVFVHLLVARFFVLFWCVAADAVGEAVEFIAGGELVVVVTVCWVKMSAGIRPSLTRFFCFMRRFWNQILTCNFKRITIKFKSFS